MDFNFSIQRERPVEEVLTSLLLKTTARNSDYLSARDEFTGHKAQSAKCEPNRHAQSKSSKLSLPFGKNSPQSLNPSVCGKC
jgi:hypothetical protein